MNQHKNPFLSPDDGPNEVDFFNIPHWQFPLTSKSLIAQPRKHLIQDCQPSTPIYSVKYQMPVVDYIEEQIEAKKQFVNTREVGFVKLNQEHRRKLINTKKTTSNMKNFIENTFRDPAKYVKGIDWNFNRGSLGIIERDDEKFLVTPHNQNSFKFLQLHPQNSLRSHEMKKNDKTFVNELMTSEKFIAMRKKKTIRVARIDEINDNDVIEASDKYEYKNVDELIASSIFNDQLMVMDSSESLVRYDLGTKKANFKFKFEKDPSRLCDMPYSLGGAKKHRSYLAKVTFTNCHEFGFIDTRTRPDKDQVTSISFDTHFAMTCEKVLNHRHSELNENLTYVVSNHVLYCLDHRKLQMPVVRWAHQLIKPPMMITTCQHFSTEFICLSSHLMGDAKIFHYDDTSYGRIAFTPSNIENSYNDLALDGHFLLSDIKERVKCATTGIALASEMKAQKINFYTQNIAGDIFETALTCFKSNPKSPLENFKLWDEHLSHEKDPKEFIKISERIERNDLVIDDIVRVDMLRKICLSEDLTSKDEEPDNLMHFKRPAWKMSIEEARKHKDIVAQEVMNYWNDLDIDEEKPSLFAEALSMAKESSNDRVTKWISRVHETNDENIIVEEINFTENIELPPTQILMTDSLQQVLDGTVDDFDNVELAIRRKKKVARKPKAAGFL